MYVDLALLDLKHMDSATHKKLVGVPNELILDNIRHIHQDLHIPVILRVPVIPGYNDSEENLREVGLFAASLGEDVEVNLLPFHKIGESKSEILGRPQNLGIEPPTNARMEELKNSLFELNNKSPKECAVRTQRCCQKTGRIGKKLFHFLQKSG